MLYAAATAQHLRRFHTPYIQALKQDFHVFTLATGEDVDFPVEIQRKVISLRNLRAVVEIRRILKRERFDAVILNTTLAAFLIRLAMVGMRHRPRVFNFVHGYLFHKPLKGKKELLYRTCESMVRGCTDEIAVMNRMDAEMAKEYRLCRGQIYETCGMGFRAPEGLSTPSKELRQQVTEGRDAFLMTFVGLLGGDKNQSFLIRATERLRREGVPAQLMLLGDGVHRPALEAEIQALGLEAYVHLMGNREPAWEYLAITDLYVSASKKEGLPFNLMEAMACGLPIVAADSKGQVDLLEEQPQCLFPLEDMDAFCESVKAVYRESKWGMGSVCYPQLERYTFSAVFASNLNMMKGFLTT